MTRQQRTRLGKEISSRQVSLLLVAGDRRRREVVFRGRRLALRGCANDPGDRRLATSAHQVNVTRPFLQPGRSVGIDRQHHLRDKRLKLLNQLTELGIVADPLAIGDLVATSEHFGEIVWEWPSSGKEIDDDDALVVRAASHQDVLKRRVADDPAIPIASSGNRGRGEHRRKASARQDMFCLQFIGVAIEQDEFAELDVDGADDEPHRARSEPREIYIFAQQVLDRARIVEAGPLIRPPFAILSGRKPARMEEARNAPEHGTCHGEGIAGMGWREFGRRDADVVPELVQRSVRIVRVACDDGSVDRADRNAAYDIRDDPPFVHGAQHATFKGAERSTALQDQYGLPREVAKVGIRIGQLRECRSHIDTVADQGVDRARLLRGPPG